jgi:hypothetical protein
MYIYAVYNQTYTRKGYRKMDIVFDFGNARWKWFNPRTNQHSDCRHALAEISTGDWNKVVGRSKTPPEGFAKVNGVPFVYGDAARRYLISQRPQGASRYHRGYYGVGAAIALSEVLEKGARAVTLWASHAPDDINYARHLTEAAKGKWVVECGHGEREFTIKDVQTFDEPLGGYCHYTYTELGKERKKNPLATQTTLVIDVGGYTTDVIAIDPGGSIDLLSAKSSRSGIIHLVEAFENDLRTNNSTLFQDTGDIDIRRIESAILTGVYKFGKTPIDCAYEAQQAITGLVNDVIQIITGAGGAANYDVMLLTGGGAAMIHDTLVKALPRVEFLLAEPNRDLMKFANVFGGAKLAAMLRSLGAV